MVVKPNQNDNSSFKNQNFYGKNAQIAKSSNSGLVDNVQNQILRILVSQNKITQENANNIILKANQEGNNIIQVLRESNIIQPDDLARSLAEFYKLPFVVLKDLNLNPEIVNRLPQDISKNYYSIVFDIIGDKLFKIATSRPENPKVVQIMDFLKTKNNIDTELYVASETDLQNASELFNKKKVITNSELVKNPIAGEIAKKTEGKITSSFLDSTTAGNNKKPDEDQQNRSDESAIDFQNLLREDIRSLDSLKDVIESGIAPNIIAALVKYAINLKASDIHIEPEEKDLRVRFRIDGVLRNIINLNINLHPAIIARIKISAHLKIDEQRIPQDGRFAAIYDNKRIDIRVSTLPASHGEKVVMRLLDKTQGVITIEELGLIGKGYNSLIKNIKKPYGMILATGPTGSGKTTTLYAILQFINNPQINIVTLEDPIEYQLEGVNHCQVRPDIGFDFANGLRSIVRQDPNVIMVGEIRDKETAEMAIHAALTGHLLLSTLHTNNAAGAIPRLIDMGIEPFLITSTLNVIIAQRLVRKLCEKCRIKTTIPQELSIKIEKEINALPPDIRQKYPQKPVFYTAKGCQYCTNGYSGRIGLFEVLDINEAIGELTVKKATTEEINELAVKNGMLTIRQDGLIKALAGITSLDEVLRISLSE